jgi:hypothetical protein
VDLAEGPDLPIAWRLFHESATQVLVTCDPSEIEFVREIVADYSGLLAEQIGNTTEELFEIRINGAPVIREQLAGLHHRWDTALESMLDEVTA